MDGTNPSIVGIYYMAPTPLLFPSTDIIDLLASHSEFGTFPEIAAEVQGMPSQAHHRLRRTALIRLLPPDLPPTSACVEDDVYGSL